MKNQPPLQIRLTEPVIFLRGPSTGADFRGRPQSVRDGQPAMVRGLLTLRLNKPTRIRNISINLDGKSRTEWPEGIGSRRTETYEEHQIINETTTFFSGTDYAAAKIARRTQSLGPGTQAQYDLSSDEEEGDDEDEAYDLRRSRKYPRSASVLPSNPDDWMSWHRDGLSRPVSPEPELPSHQDSVASLTNLRADPIRERGPSPAYTPSYTPPISSGNQSLPDVTSGLRSHADGADSSSTAAETRGSNHALAAPDDVWHPSTPAGNPENAIFPAVTDPGLPTTSAIRFQSPERHKVELNGDGGEAEDVLSPMPTAIHASPPILANTSPSLAASISSIPQGAPLSLLPSRAESTQTIDSRSSDANEYHPVMAAHRTAVNTPMGTPPSMSPRLGSPRLGGGGFLDEGERERPGASRRRSSGLRAAQTPSSGVSPIASNLPSPRTSMDLDSRFGRGPGSIFGNGTAGSGSDLPSSTASTFAFNDDLRGRKNHHHKFSLSAALRGLSQDIHDRVRGGHSRSQSRASSRTRGTETPRTPHWHLPESVPSSQPMSRNSSVTNLRAAVDESFKGRRSRSRDNRGQSPGRRDDSRGRSRNRRFGKDEDEDVHNWREFRKGIYNYPISFTIPLNAPPTIHSEFGSVVYKLKATVVRVGALTSNFVEEMEVNMVAGPQEDDMEETDNVIVERQWEDQMRYQIALSGKAFPIGGVIPMSIRLMPLAKCKIHRLTVALEEKTDYFAVGKKIARHETPRRFILFSAKNTDPHRKERPEPLLPILSDTVCLKDSPLAEMARNAALNNPREFAEFSNPEDDVYASLCDPLGPWHLEKDLIVPDCHTRIKFTTKHEQTNISVGHWLKVTLRVERGDDHAVDSKGRRKQFDIIIETPIKILDCRVNPQYNSLPSYERLGAEQNQVSNGCTVHAKAGGAQVLPRTVLIGTSAAVHAASHAAHVVLDAIGSSKEHPPPAAHTHHPRIEDHSQDEDTLLERNIVFDRLMSGQETETGELPPTYGEAVANAIRSARSASRAASRAPSVIPSVPVSRVASRTLSRNASRARLYIGDDE